MLVVKMLLQFLLASHPAMTGSLSGFESLFKSRNLVQLGRYQKGKLETVFFPAGFAHDKVEPETAVERMLLCA